VCLQVILPPDLVRELTAAAGAFSAASQTPLWARPAFRDCILEILERRFRPEETGLRAGVGLACRLPACSFEVASPYLQRWLRPLCGRGGSAGVGAPGHAAPASDPSSDETCVGENGVGEARLGGAWLDAQLAEAAARFFGHCATVDAATLEATSGGHGGARPPAVAVAGGGGAPDSAGTTEITRAATDARELAWCARSINYRRHYSALIRENAFSHSAL
jgi:hypothetical protein